MLRADRIYYSKKKVRKPWNSERHRSSHINPRKVWNDITQLSLEKLFAIRDEFSETIQVRKNARENDVIMNNVRRLEGLHNLVEYVIKYITSHVNEQTSYEKLLEIYENNERRLYYYLSTIRVKGKN